MQVNRDSLSAWLDKILWALLLGVSTLGVQTLKDMSSNINELNQKIAIVLEWKTILQDHSDRLRALEKQGK